MAQNVNADSIISVLKKELLKKDVYDVKKEKQIAHLKIHLQDAGHKSPIAQYNICFKIFNLYRAYKFDSAFVYVNKMIGLSGKLNDPEKLTRSRLLLGSILLNSGLYKEAFDVAGQLEHTQLPTNLRSEYLILRARLYAGIAEYNNDSYFSKIYAKCSKGDFKSAEVAVPSSDFEQTISKAFLPASTRDKYLSPHYYYNYILNHNLGERGIAMVSTRLSFAYTGQNRIFFLALAAINDVRSATKETLAIFLLSQELYKLNRTEDAYKFIQEAAKNAKYYGARNRQVQIQSILPIVATKLLAEKQHEKDKLLIGFLIFLIIVIVLFFVLVIYRKQLTRIKANEVTITEQNIELRNVNEKLWEASHIKEELIGLFLKTCSAYIDTLDKVKRKTLHTIKLGKFNEIKPILDGIHIDKEKENLYQTLDSAFVKIFPNFVSSFNTLLNEDDQIWPKRGETLNPTLRIFALMRLGINELPTVAKILGYSESTVYSYKVRVKSKALVHGNDFEKRIMDIKITV
ncbi:DUF6377 domain-containing protein [Mucilaginibacter sp. UR6-1]|uniref:DUF6377 domain-containing protein n=1 Tax=Mucilaginibacter sp. UR6-1 TaxID=1435643 RepID=UPI001E328B85|nr:DUF6377 domain-containing protein [Mucilaginibacter sp. UR6-1]MCC8407844.1 DUF6377 domain-containing protein [Mucilaginibacter sp. UR6-1]